MTVMSSATVAPRARAARAEVPAEARYASVRRAAARWWPLLPLIATVLLLAMPLLPVGGDGSLGPADVASGVLVVFCFLRVLRLRARPLTPVAAVVLGLPVAAIAVATVTAADPFAALPGLVRYLQVFVLVPAAVLLLLRDARDFRVITGCLAVLALAQGAVGVRQFITGTGASYMGADIRAVGTFGPTDVMGMATVVSYGLLAVTAFALRPPEGTHPRVRLMAVALAGVLVVPLALSFSRGAWIATVAVAVVMILLTGLRRAVPVFAALTAAGVVLVGGFGVGSEMISERLTSITQVAAAPDQSVTDRYTMWAAAASMWREEPATGVGLKGFPAHRDGHASIGLSAGSDTAGAGQSYQKQPLLSPHNMYLLILSEQGLIGVTAFVTSWLAVLAAGILRLIRSRRSRGRPGAGDCGLAAVGLLLWQTVDFLYADIGGPSTVLTGVVLGLAAWWALGERPRKETTLA